MTTLSLFRSFKLSTKGINPKFTQQKEQVKNEPKAKEINIVNDSIIVQKKIKGQSIEENPQMKTNQDLSPDLELQMNKLYRMRQFRKFSQEALIQRNQSDIQQNEQENQQNHKEQVQQTTSLQRSTQQNIPSLQMSQHELKHSKDSFVNYVTERICMCQEQIKRECTHAIDMNSQIINVSIVNNKTKQKNPRQSQVDSNVQKMGEQNKTQITTNNNESDNSYCLLKQLKTLLLIASMCTVTFLYIPILLLFIMMAVAHSSALSIMNMIQCRHSQPSFVDNLVKYYQFQKQRVIQLYLEIYKCFYRDNGRYER